MSENQKQNSGRKEPTVIAINDDGLYLDLLLEDKNIDLVVFEYNYGCYSGEGTLVCYSAAKQLFWVYDLGHCSCYGPEDTFISDPRDISTGITLAKFWELKENVQDDFDPNIRKIIEKWLDGQYIYTPWDRETVPKITISVLPNEETKKTCCYKYSLLFQYISHEQGLLRSPDGLNLPDYALVSPSIITLKELYEKYTRLDGTPCGEQYNPTPEK